MNILFYNDIPFNPLFGGIERVTDVIAKGLLAYNNEYKIYYMFDKVKNPDLLKYDFPAELLELPYSGGFNEQRNIDYFIEVLDANNIDIVINQRGECVWNNFTKKSITTSKIVSVLHNTVSALLISSLYNHLNYFSKSFMGYIKYGLKRFFPFLLERYVRRRVTPILEAHYNNLVEISDAIVVLSKQYVKDLNVYVDVSKTRVLTIPNPNTFDFTPVDFSMKNKTILYVGRLDPGHKAPIRLLHIWKMIYKKHSDWNLVIVGSGDAEQQMKDYADKNCLPRVNFEGSKRNVEKYYKEASILCLTSNYEAWGMALTEGMTFGCVPFTFGENSAAYDIIDDGENGCIIPTFNLRQYAYRLSEVMSDDKKRLALGQAAQEKVKQFSSRNIVKQWDELFHELVER